MNKLSLKILSAVIGGGICFTGLASAQSSSGGMQAPSGATVPNAQDSANRANAGATQTPASFTEAEILGVVLAVDENEIAAASKAEKQKLSADAMTYAKMLHKEHKANKEATKKVGKTLGIKHVTSPTADNLRAKGEADLKSMASLKGTDFEKAYIDAMVQGHTDALQLLDTQLIPSAKSDALKTHLTDTRNHVAMHLEQGKRLQQSQATRTE